MRLFSRLALPRRAASLGLSALLLATACGSDDDSDTGQTSAGGSGGVGGQGGSSGSSGQSGSSGKGGSAGAAGKGGFSGSSGQSGAGGQSGGGQAGSGQAGGGTVGSGQAGGGQAGGGQAGGGAAGVGGSSGGSGQSGAGGSQAGAAGASPCGDTTSSPQNCGKCGNVCGAGLGCVLGECVCPSYQSQCGGVCIPTSVDPQNCGGCGKVCGPSEVCSAGSCEGSCLPGLTACGGVCTDTKNDSANCGACGVVCPEGTGCAQNTCVPAAPLGPAPAKCGTGGGPPIVIPFVGDTGAGKCASNLAQTTFTWGICACENVQWAGSLLVDGFDSTKGAYKPGELGAGIGVNGQLIGSKVDDWGTLWGPGKLGASGDVHHELHAGSFNSTGLAVGADAWVSDKIGGIGISIAKTLHVPSKDNVGSGVTYGSLVEEPVSIAAPCACEEASLIPVAKIVAARKSNNDNALIGLDPAFADVIPQGQSRIDLPCGEYYLNKIGGGGKLTIAAHGHTALYIGGDATIAGDLALLPDPDASLDIFIDGDLGGAGTLTVGSPNYPALTRVYVTGNVSGAGNKAYAANIYAPQGKFGGAGDVEMYGAVFAGNLTNAGDVKIHYDRHVVVVGDQDCPSEGPKACASCGDCGNQACVNGQCGGCTDSSQCCAPLSCYNGACQLLIKP